MPDSIRGPRTGTCTGDGVAAGYPASYSGNEQDTSDPVKASNQARGNGAPRHRHLPGKGQGQQMGMCLRLQLHSPAAPHVAVNPTICPSVQLYMCVHVHVCTCTCAYVHPCTRTAGFLDSTRGGRQIIKDSRRPPEHGGSGTPSSTGHARMPRRSSPIARCSGPCPKAPSRGGNRVFVKWL